MRAVKSQMGPKTQVLIDEIDQLAISTFTKLLQDGRETGEWTGTLPTDLGARYLHAQYGLALDQRARGQDPRDTLELAISALEF